MQLVGTNCRPQLVLFGVFFVFKKTHEAMGRSRSVAWRIARPAPLRLRLLRRFAALLLGNSRWWSAFYLEDFWTPLIALPFMKQYLHSKHHQNHSSNLQKSLLSKPWFLWNNYCSLPLILTPDSKKLSVLLPRFFSLQRLPTRHV